jgi:hypothetical protein
LYHIVRLALVILPVILTVAFATAQVPVWQSPPTVFQGETTPLAVEQKPGDTYTWELFNDSTVNFAVASGTVTAAEAFFVDGIDDAPAVSVTWLEPGVYFYRLMAVDLAGCTNNLRVGRIEVLEALPTAELRDTAICIGEPGAMIVDLTGTAPWNLTLTDGTNSYPFTGIMDDTFELTFAPGPKTTTEYWVSQVSDFYGTNNQPSEKAEMIIYPKPDSSQIYRVSN